MYAKPKSEIEAAIRAVAETALQNVGKPIQTPRGDLSKTQVRSPDPNRGPAKAANTIKKIARIASSAVVDTSAVPKTEMPPIDVDQEMQAEEVKKPKRKRRRKKKPAEGQQR